MIVEGLDSRSYDLQPPLSSWQAQNHQRSGSFLKRSSFEFGRESWVCSCMFITCRCMATYEEPRLRPRTTANDGSTRFHSSHHRARHCKNRNSNQYRHHLSNHHRIKVARVNIIKVVIITTPSQRCIEVVSKTSQSYSSCVMYL